MTVGGQRRFLTLPLIVTADRPPDHRNVIVAVDEIIVVRPRAYTDARSMPQDGAIIDMSTRQEVHVAVSVGQIRDMLTAKEALWDTPW
jgi:hypothetical protein